MLIDNKPYHTIWFDQVTDNVKIIDQTCLPHELKIIAINNMQQAAHAIAAMQVRGAPLIGAMAAFGLYLAVRDNPEKESIRHAVETLAATRPTAVNLQWALNRVISVILPLEESSRSKAALNEAIKICQQDIEVCRRIGEFGLTLIQDIHKKNPHRPINILTHCNAGWLATVDWGTATSPIYHAHKAGIPIHIWVDETRPRNQGAALTCYELKHENISHTLVVDNAGGHLMQNGQVDMMITGSDRTTRCGDVANKIGTYLKALAAQHNNIPFYAAVPSTTIDWDICEGKAIPIENRSAEEVTHINGLTSQGDITQINIAPNETAAANPAFDVTPASLVTGIITEKGVSAANETALAVLFSSD